MALVEQNYGVKKSEMLAIVEAYKYWKHYLKGAMYSVWIVTDHSNFHKFLTTKTFLQYKAKWWEHFSGLDLAIEYGEGRIILLMSFSNIQTI